MRESLRWQHRRTLSEHEVNGAEQAESRPQKIEGDRLPHVDDGERHEDAQRDDLLNDLQLRERHHPVAQSIGGNLQEILEQRDSPAENRGNIPRTIGKIAKVRVPRNRHEEVRAD